MKVIKLSDEDHTLLVAAHAACDDAEQVLTEAHKNNKQVQATYTKVLDQLKRKYKLKGSASDDQQFLFGYTIPEGEPVPQIPEPAEPIAPLPVEQL